MSNIQTFNARSVAATPKIDNVSAGKNLVNINLTNANLHHQEANKGAFDGNVDFGLRVVEEVREYTLEELMAFDEEINTSLSESNLKDKSLEEILEEGQETHEEVILARNQAKAQEAIDKINDIGKVDLNSKDEIEKAIDAYNSLTPEQKALVPPEKLDELKDAQNEFNKKQIEEAERKRKEKEKELEALYKARDDNNGLFHPKKEKAIEAEIAKLEAELGVPHKPDGWEKFCDGVEEVGAQAGTFVMSAVEGFVDLGEGVIDAHIYGVAKTLQVFGVDDKWAEDIIAYDASAEMYDWMVEATGIDKDIAYGPAHSAGNFVGEMVGYYALSSVPYVGPALCCIAGAGSAAEDSINTQLAETGEVNDWRVFGASALGALEGYGFGKAATAAKAGFKAIGQAGVKQTLKTTFGSISKETLKTTAKNGGKIVVTAAGRTFTDVDTYVDVAAVVGDDVIKGIDTGEWDWGTIIKEGSVAIGGNYIGNLGAGVLDSATGKTQTVDLDDGKKTTSVVPRGKRKIKIGGQDIATNLTDDELLKFANDFYNLKPPITSLNDYPNYGVIEDVSSIKLEDGKITVDWVENQGAVYGTRKPTTIAAGAEIDRYGNPNGNFFGKMDVDANGNYVGVDYDKRSLPYTEGSQSYTKVKVVKDINSDSLSKAMSNLKTTDPDFYKEITIQMKKDGFKYTELPDGTVKIEVNEAKIAPAYGHNGGGVQYELPIRSEYLKELGFLSY